MYANLLGQKAFYHLTDEEMGKIIGVSRNAYNQKLRNGKFWPNECQALCMYFHKSFDYLFATEGEPGFSHRAPGQGAEAQKV